MDDFHKRRAFERDYEDECAGRAQDGRRIARLDADVLADLAEAIRASVMVWGDLYDGLDLAAARPFDPDLARSLVAECVFDDLLRPAAWRILASALEEAG